MSLFHLLGRRSSTGRRCRSLRRFAVVGFALLAVVGVAAPASADPTTTGYDFKRFSLHFDQSGCSGNYLFGDEGGYNNCTGVFTSGHTDPFNSRAPGIWNWHADNSIDFYILDTSHHIQGTIPNRGSNAFTLTTYNLYDEDCNRCTGPAVEGAKPGEKGGPLNLNVVRSGVFVNHYDVYLDGYLYLPTRSTEPPTGPFGLPAGLFGS